MSSPRQDVRFAFFGTPDRAVWALDELEKAGLVPALVVTQPDRPQGRKLILTPPPVKEWAERRSIPVLQPETLDAAFAAKLAEASLDCSVVVAYGKIMKREILDIPRHGSINLHASLLPKLRGASPIESSILEDDRDTGVTIILMDELMDHGPILAQKAVSPQAWPLPAGDLARLLVAAGGRLLAETLPLWAAGRIEPREQDHARATKTRKISKEDGLLDLAADGYRNFLKYNAYRDWPGTYFYILRSGRQMRVSIKAARYENGTFVIERVVPEGKREMSWQDFARAA